MLMSQSCELSFFYQCFLKQSSALLEMKLKFGIHLAPLFFPLKIIAIKTHHFPYWANKSQTWMDSFVDMLVVRSNDWLS